MKKRFLALSFVLLLVVSAAGCAGEARPPRQPLQEPDTAARTQTRTIGYNQKVVYRFHASAINTWDDDRGIDLVFFDRDAASYDQADNWCISWIGKAPGLGQSYNAFSPRQGPNTAKESAWTKPFWDSPPKWLMWGPYGRIDDVENADMVLTFSRSGKNVRAVLEIDGITAWRGEHAIGHLTNEEIYLYLSLNNFALSNVTFQDMGGAGWLPSFLGRLLTAVAALAGAYFLHRLARKGEDKLFIDGLIGTLLSTGLAVCGLGLLLLLYGRGHPGILSAVSLGCLSLPMPAGGAGFWIPTAIFGIGTAVFTIALLCLAVSEAGNPLAYLLCSIPLGLCHALWLTAVAYIILQSLGAIIELIVAILAIAGLCLLGRVFTEMDKTPHIERTTTTRIYNSAGTLVDFKCDIEYEELPENKKK